MVYDLLSPKECWAVCLMRTPERAIMSNCLNYAKEPWDFSRTREGALQIRAVSAPDPAGLFCRSGVLTSCSKPLVWRAGRRFNKWEIWARSKLICCALFRHEMEIPSGQGDGSWDFERITFKGSHEIGSNKDTAHMLIIRHALLKVV